MERANEIARLFRCEVTRAALIGMTQTGTTPQRAGNDGCDQSKGNCSRKHTSMVESRETRVKSQNGAEGLESRVESQEKKSR